MALIFLGLLGDYLDFIANDEWPQFTQPQSAGVSGLGQCWSLITSCNHRRSQDFVWGCTFFPKKLTTFFSRRPQNSV